ncbi:MAG: glycosyltransferase family 4 protein, partial [Candidatus Micrarchaeaceae archaeon]
MGVDTSAFTARAPKAAGTVFELLFVGRLTEAKGVLYFCEAIRLLRERRVPVHATIIGDGDARPAIDAYIVEYSLQDTITLTGGLPHDQLATYYAAADTFVGPSIESKEGWKEAFGVVFAEAAAVGVPIVATTTGGIKDIVHDGINGLLVPQKDASAIADAVQRLQQNPELCARLGTAGPSIVAEHFSWQTITQKYLAVLHMVVNA